MLSRTDLHDYQHKTIEFIKEKKRCALFLFMGAGKTTTTLTAISDLTDGFQVNKVLIIAPLRVANSVWAQECENWAHLKHLKVNICTGSEKNRLASLHSSADIFTINRENVPWLVELYGKKWPFDCVVIDESSSFKNASSKRFKALKKVLPFTDYMVLLTGTPAPNGLLDLWAQMFLVDFGEALGRTITGYKQRFFEQDGFMGYTLKPRPDATEKVYRLVDDRVLSMTADDYLELPERIDLTALCELPARTAKLYREFEKELLLELDCGEEIEASSAAVLANKLLQWCNGAVYTDEHKNWSELHTVKLDALADIVADNTGENILVAYNYKTDLERLKKRFPDAVVLDKNPQTIADWNGGKIPMLLAHPACLHPSTEVLTEFRGWIKIIDVCNDERVFDGVEFVSHKGCSFSGVKPVITTMGITLTDNHKLLIDDEWIEAKNVRDCADTRRKALYTYAGNDDYLSEMLPLRGSAEGVKAECGSCESAGAKALPTLHQRNFPQYDQHKNMANLEGDGIEKFRHKQQRLRQIRCCWSELLRKLAEIREFFKRHGGRLSRRFDVRSKGQHQRLQQRELPMGDKHGAAGQQNKQSNNQPQRENDTPCGVLQARRREQGGDNTKAERWYECGRSVTGLSKLKLQEEQKVSKVYDLVDCGKRNRFLIRNSEGDVFISHNSAGHGLNLQKGGALAVWFGLNWSLELYQQFNARLHRQGQLRPVRIIHIVVGGCIDERVLKVINEKDATQSKLIEALK